MAKDGAIVGMALWNTTPADMSAFSRRWMPDWLTAR